MSAPQPAPHRHLIVVDVETNGLDLDVHEAIEVAWWNLNTDERGTFIPAHNPSRVLGAAQVQALRVNRYIDRIAGQPQDHSETELARLHDQFRTWPELPDDLEAEPGPVVHHVLAGSNPRFDAQMISKLFGGADPDRFDEPAPWHHRLWDLSAYAAGVLGLDHLPGLAEVCERLEVDPPDHSAEGDVTATGQCFTLLRLRAGAPL